MTFILVLYNITGQRRPIDNYSDTACLSGIFQQAGMMFADAVIFGIEPKSLCGC